MTTTAVESLRAKFFGMMLGILLIAGSITAVLVVGAQNRLNNNRLQREGEKVCSYLARINLDPLIAKNFVQVDSNIKDAVDNNDVLYIILRDQDARAVNSFFTSLNFSQPFVKDVVARLPKGYDLAMVVAAIKGAVDVREITSPIASGGELLGSVTIGLSMEDAHHYSVYTIGSVVVASMIAGVIAFLLLIVFHRKTIQPIIQLAELTRDISETKNYSLRTPFASNDEIGVLARSINAMLDEIQVHHKELQQSQKNLESVIADLRQSEEELKSANELIEDYNKTLEAKVEQRTNELQDSQRRLLQSSKMAAVGQLAGGIAHEINNPLTVILGFAQYTVKKLGKEHDLYEPLEAIEREANRCKKLVGDLLTFSRTSKGQSDVVDINKVIEDTLKLVQVESKGKNIRFDVRYGTLLPAIPGDANHLQQVLVNLCNNAVDAMPDGGTVTITSEKRETGVIVTVTDTGTGMTEGVRQHLFEPFFTTKEVGKGTGLGLSICYEIIHQHNGTIEAESAVGKGTTFTIGLPFRATAL
jgi:signal transduction histidine kinase